MSGVLAAFRQAHLSCSALGRGAISIAGGVGAAVAAIGSAAAAVPALAADPFDLPLNLDRHEMIAVVLGFAMLGFSVVAAVLLLRARLRSARTEQALRAQIQTLQTEADRYRTLLFVEQQVLIAWAAGAEMPEISGDLSMLSPRAADHPPQRILAFATWLHPEQALQLDRAVDALRDRGESFLFQIVTSVGRTVEVMGRAVGGQAVVRIRELTGVRRELSELSQRFAALNAESSLLRAFMQVLPYPLWTRRDNGALAYVNDAYARATDAASPEDALARSLELLDTDDRSALARALGEGKTFEARLPVISGGERRMVDIRAARLSEGSAGIAIDASEATALREAMTRMAEAQRRILDQLSSGVAVFDGERRLIFHNESYRRLWELDPAFLETRPDDSAVLDRLRAERKLPEQPDFRQWKMRLHEAYRAVEAARDIWYLPDGRAVSVVTTSNPEGGVTYLFDDVTERLDLARRYDSLIRVQRETLDNLVEGVAVFGSNGRARLFNPAFARMWKIAPEALSEEPHIETVEEWCRPLYSDDTGLQMLRGAITSIENRSPISLRLERRDGSVIDCTALPLPDGATMLTFQDVTDTVNVERALRERNDALETADQMKIDFVHHVSYELRSPLTTIIGFAHLISDPTTGPMTSKQSEYLGYITSSTNALLAIINNILDLATIDAGAMTLTLGPVDVRAAIEQAAAGVQDRLTHHNIALRVDIGPGVSRFVADESRVVQVLYNLLANAAGFSPENSAIDLTAHRTETSIVFAVTDRGPGIPQDVRDRVFDWFESHANGSRHRGAGLGLSLVRSFVELHGGKVRVESAVGKGTTVICEFPVDRILHRDAAE